jgi:hypothetical protein
MANNMQLLLQECVSLKVISLQTVSVVIMKALQHLRIKYRWRIEKKTNNSKEQGLKHIPFTFENDDTPNNY